MTVRSPVHPRSSPGGVQQSGGAAYAKGKNKNRGTNAGVADLKNQFTFGSGAECE
jgi:hypothetical protein